MIDRRILVSLLGVLLTVSALSAGAQIPAANQIPAEEELTGLQAAVWRHYAPAGSSVGTGVITLDEATPVSSPSVMSQLRLISVVVREFDTSENAASAFEQIRAGVEASVADVFSGGEQEITSEALPDIGSQATLVRIEYAGQGTEVWMENVIVQRDQYVFFVSADASVFRAMPGSEDVDKSLPRVEIATAIASNGEPSPNEPTFTEDGTSTGGLWGFMLPADDPLLMGLVPVQDVIVYPNPSG